ncbi:methyltransferase domain-containing protein [Tuwongella immobilis]|uniref:Methyltransferase domain-containing protein n=1 Tax=Tuwongella immobilis TaxID=692036 RepID=A0A6C2YPP9_9BACT|nr:methyltransferase domain-containing protein [Tuwongella immobilis]VIP03005.1 methyltransferase : Methyltransferase type 11 OS=Mycobacterium rhodesiae JS60 GN=MycrhDRAFT_3459 PE=4 SV=1: Methyltransf_11 [Tuwongella immobilis]VTS03102.1 methyltransferase : Methyltransferase type 11 OS=Mycobacterium rhodesiae JS60 GN=MycrhDRAFT_3459 PE=4 SV=1: Methyltransf_11 [Tuwongella immobilis]
MAASQSLANPLKLVGRAVKQSLRSVYRSFVPLPVREPLPADGCRAGLEVLTPTRVVSPGESFTLGFRIRNCGTRHWSSAGQAPVLLRARWLTTKKQPTPFPERLIALPGTILPGQLKPMPITMTAPQSLGQFLLELDLVQNPGKSFAEMGNRVGYADIQVTGHVTDNIDYYQVFATADLERDYWTSVGPSTEAEYHRLAWKKLDQLKEVGLKPSSRVLDLGCGTGQLAVSLQEFLSEQGEYFGTDIGAEAIDYCKRKFKRPNFGFAVNEMTKIPVAGRQFDFITLFSVFTHTYPDETVLLLAEAKRLLAPNGLIFADTFVSPLVDRFSGNRYAIEWNLEHLHRLIALAGLKATKHESWKWQENAERVIWLIRHA